MTAPRFGYCLPIFANPSAGLFRTPNLETVNARETLLLGIHADALGYDSLWVADHLMLGRDEAILEGWTMLSALAGATTGAKLGMIHQAHYFREPAIAAKMSATLDQVSGGRFIMFYDYGQQLRENRAYHLDYPESVDEKVTATIDGIRLIRDLWQADTPITVSHGAVGVTNATCTPLPLQQPHPPIWFGEVHPGLLAACAEFGQGWNTTPCGLDEFRRRIGLLRDACETVGRDPSDIEASLEIQVLIGETDADVRQVLGRMLDAAPNPAEIDADLRAFANGTRDEVPAAFAASTLIGTPEQVAAQVSAYQAAGADHFMLWFLDAPDRTGMDLFAKTVLPQFRSA